MNQNMLLYMPKTWTSVNLGCDLNKLIDCVLVVLFSNSCLTVNGLEFLGIFASEKVPKFGLISGSKSHFSDCTYPAVKQLGFLRLDY